MSINVSASANELSEFLCSESVEALLLVHPNKLCVNNPVFEPLPQWSSWWAWAGRFTQDGSKTNCGPDDAVASTRTEPKWLQLIRYYMSPHDWTCPRDSHSIPEELRSLMDNARRLQLPRQPGMSAGSSMPTQHTLNSQDIPDSTRQPESRFRGMSPKKAHEVLQMSSYISKLLGSSPELSRIKHVVDVGAGQAYLSRALRDDLGLHVLALDWSDVQSKGAARKDALGKKKRKQDSSVSSKLNAHAPVGDGRTTDPVAASAHVHSTGSLTYKTLEITTESLLGAVDDWIQGSAMSPIEARQAPTPVLFVALHACGSLTPHVLRAFVSRLRADGPPTWVPSAAVVVGCCYNLLESGDFPLSRMLADPASGTPQVHLTANHLQLAAQVPSQWLRTEESLDAAKLAIRKVVWRALLGGILERHDLHIGSDASAPDDCQGKSVDSSGMQDSGKPRRLGRLNDAAYTDWHTFLSRASTRLGIDLEPGEELESECERAMESRLEVLHVLRCILGPLVESLILLDRKQWLEEELQGTGMSVQLVNLFDQATGSGRNVAIVVTPPQKTL